MGEETCLIVYLMIKELSILFLMNQSPFANFFIGDLSEGSTYLLIKSCKSNSESLKSLGLLSFPCL